MPTFKKTATALALGLAASFSAQAAEELNFYNWSDYIAEDTIENFEKQTGIKVTADVFDSNEVLEAKMLAGNSGYDIVVPSATFMARQIQAGVFQELDKSKMPNYKGLDKGLMKTLAGLDEGNKHGIPYLWGTTGIGYNVKLVEKALGKDAPVDSWDLVFKPENLAKLKDCGVSVLDSADEIYPLALHYVGMDPGSKNAADYKKNSKAAQLLKDIRPSITQFHSSQYINNLANGDICVAIGWSGDILQAMDRADEAENGVEIAYTIPVEGTSVWFDMLTIPKEAKNADNAYKFINYLLNPKVMADISNYVWYPNGVPASKALLDEEISSNPSIYPSDEVQAKLFPLVVHGPKISKLQTRFWANLKAGR
ncbi:MAG: spermidine/putrescine ABC transporter substrate-binding protein PotF [Bermanella sp.]|nr:spermidine/putrescine ABC transporter substrate-binding protein PotF [Bermanella sp.]